MFPFLCIASYVCAVLATPNVLKLDFRRELVHGNGLDRWPLDIPMHNDLQNSVLPQLRYTVNLTIGSPGQPVSLILDTGSSDVWVPATNSPGCVSFGCPYGTFNLTRSSSFENLNLKFNGTYGISGNETSEIGQYFNDILRIGSATIPNMTMAVVNLTKESVEEATFGVLGVGYRAIEGTAEQQYPTTPTVYDQLVSLNYSSRRAFSLWLDNQESSTGTILFGGIDTSKYQGNLVSLPVQPWFGRLWRYDIALTSIELVDHHGAQLLSTKNFSVAATLDSGTPTMNLPPMLAGAIATGLGAITDQGQQFVPCALRGINASLTFGFGGSGGPQISVPFSALILPPQVTGNLTTKNGAPLCLLGVTSTTGTALLGDTFMRSAYIVYDIDNNQIALAPAKYNTGEGIIVPIPLGTGLPGVSSTATLMLPPSLVPQLASTVLPTSLATATAPSGTATLTFHLGTSAATAVASPSSTTTISDGVQIVPLLSAAMIASLLAIVSVLAK